MDRISALLALRDSQNNSVCLLLIIKLTLKIISKISLTLFLIAVPFLFYDFSGKTDKNHITRAKSFTCCAEVNKREAQNKNDCHKKAQNSQKDLSFSFVNFVPFCGNSYLCYLDLILNYARFSVSKIRICFAHPSFLKSRIVSQFKSN